MWFNVLLRTTGSIIQVRDDIETRAMIQHPQRLFHGIILVFSEALYF